MRTAIFVPRAVPRLIAPPRPYGARRQVTLCGNGPTVKRAIAPGLTGTSGPISEK
ncbi:MAG: hypothetical protein QOJ29_440 [Thermoleophilaceae bacterium]|nr:hypothetical protein [Thermoleophilaceae bacterium]